jgi:DnaJ-class molecular chaperone
MHICAKCGGTGKRTISRVGLSNLHCELCKGRGATPDRWVRCPDCKGEGLKITPFYAEECTRCEKSGFVREPVDSPPAAA